MAPKMLLALLVSLFLLVAPSLAGVICEVLPEDLCAFAVSSSSKRCVLERYQREHVMTEYQCRTSEVVVDRMADYVETDRCVNACGVDRDTAGISSDALLESQFAGKLCSPECYMDCLNIADLYFNLAAGEGVFLPDMCKAMRENPHRAMSELSSSGAASAPVSGEQTRLLGETSFLSLAEKNSQMGDIYVASLEMLVPAPSPSPSPSAYA